jgi:hypothetical protein
LATCGAYTAAVDSGVPQTSKRSGTPTGGGGVTKTGVPKAGLPKGAARSNGNGSARPGPVDPRTEDPSSPLGVSRAGKTLWRRPGTLTPRTDKHREIGGVDGPIDFTVALSLSPPAETATDPLLETQPIAAAAAATVEVWTPVADPQELVPTELVPTSLRAVPPTAPLPGPVIAPSPTILYDEAATIDDVTQIGPVLESRPLRKPVHFRRGPRPRVRRVTRVVRHVDTWSVFKVALVFNVFFYAVTMVAGVLLWQVAYATGTIDNVEKFFEGFGWETFKFNGGQIFHNAWIAGVFMAVGLTGLAVLMATLFNLITDLVGGVRFSVLEEEVRTRAERGTEPAPQAAPEPAPVEVVESPVADDDSDFDESITTPPDEAIVG